jgi:hypothetical protein
LMDVTPIEATPKLPQLLALKVVVPLKLIA